jgi:predicted dehydrogenase
MNDTAVTRRRFITRSAAGAAGVVLAARSASARVAGANDRLSLGIIGCGGRGTGHMGEVHQFDKELNAEITAVCDVWKPGLEAAAARVKGWYGKEPRKFTDYRELLALDDVDAVTIGTPDFGHAYILADAARAGKDAYVEKPMASDMKSANDSLDAVKQAGTVVQVGTQKRSEGRYAAAAELVGSGVLGKLSRIEMTQNFNQPRWRRGYSDIKEADVDWKSFRMHLPTQPFDPARFRQWHLYKDYTTGLSGLWMSHFIDLVPWLTGDPFPANAVANGGIYAWNDGREHADTFHTLISYPQGFLVSWEMSLCNEAYNRFTVHGSNGTLDVYAGTATGDGGAGAKKIKEPIPLPKKEGTHHMKNWLECIRTRKTPNASIDDGYRHSVACIMAALAYETGRRQVFDSEKREIREG